MTKSLSSLITGRRFKYLIILFWLIVVGIAASLAGKLTDVQKNDAKSWLPGSAESTQVLDTRHRSHRRTPFRQLSSMNGRPGSRRPTGPRSRPTPRSSPRYPISTVRSTGPAFSDDGQAAQIIVPLNLGPDGWELAAESRSP